MTSQSSYLVKLYVKYANACENLIGTFKVLQVTCFLKIVCKTFFPGEIALEVTWTQTHGMWSAFIFERNKVWECIELNTPNIIGWRWGSSSHNN